MKWHLWLIRPLCSLMHALLGCVYVYICAHCTRFKPMQLHLTTHHLIGVQQLYHHWFLSHEKVTTLSLPLLSGGLLLVADFPLLAWKLLLRHTCTHAYNRTCQSISITMCNYSDTRTHASIIMLTFFKNLNSALRF